MKQLIAIVEDDEDIARLVGHHLESAGYRLRSHSSAAEVISAAEKEPPSLFLLDIMVPGGDGLDLCHQIRQRSSLALIPVIFLTAKSAEADRVLGLEMGADDYISKPFSPRELIARVKAVLRRFERPLSQTVVTAGDIEINPITMVVKVRGSPIATTATEFRLLDYFARNPTRVFTRDKLLDAVWRDTSFVTPRSIDVYVRRLREKIELDPENPEYLKTVRGVGYKFEAAK
ncbi:MAG TPA: response regulator transcription factor [Terriglobales bacterium]|nr:response regulator transcription factor [Terriglobales bacterium]